jgi:hypothetical protein
VLKFGKILPEVPPPILGGRIFEKGILPQKVGCGRCSRVPVNKRFDDLVEGSTRSSPPGGLSFDVLCCTHEEEESRVVSGFPGRGFLVRMYRVSSEEKAVLLALHALVVHTFCVHFTGVVRVGESCTISRAVIAMHDGPLRGCGDEV